MFPYPKVVPQLVEDVSLKRARTEINGEDAIRVVTSGAGTITIDPQDFADGTGLVPAQTDAGSVNDNLTTVATNSTTAAQNTTTLATSIGNTTDTSSDPTVIGILKDITSSLPTSADLTTVNTNTNTLVTTTGTINTTTGTMNTTLGTINSTQGSVSDAAWTGVGDATVISLLKGIVNKL